MKLLNRLFSKSLFFSRSHALIVKEGLQMLRDKSTLTLGIVLPLMLLILFGYGLSFDVENIRVSVVKENSSPITRDIFNVFEFSPYFNPSVSETFEQAKRDLLSGKTDIIVRHSSKESQDGPRFQIIVSGRDSNTSRIYQRFAEGALRQWSSNKNWATEVSEKASANQGVRAIPRIWYNPSLQSKNFLVPGVTVLIMTLIGTLLTALVVAREWERGTYEALIGTSVNRVEIILGKTVPYFILGLIGLLLCLLTAVFVFKVPIRGSIVLLTLISSLYLIVSLGIGLFISALVKNQFLASQIVLVFSFMPTVMLSGFIFDLKSAPTFAYYLAHVFPATWFVELLQTLFLVGTVPHIVIVDSLALFGFSILFLGLTFLNINKSLE